MISELGKVREGGKKGWEKGKGGWKVMGRAIMSERKRPIYRAVLPVPHETSGKVCLCLPLTNGRSATRVHLSCMRALCARMVGWLTSIKLVAIDREKDRAESSPVRGDGIFFLSAGRVDEPSPFASRNCSSRRRPDGGRVQGLECLTAGLLNRQ